MSKQYYFDGKKAQWRPNPLARYRSYSYYHILVACDSTETAKKLYDEHRDDIDMFKVDPTLGDLATHINTNSGESSFIKKIGENNRFCVLSNGSMSCRYTISRVSWEATFFDNQSVNDTSVTSTVAEQGEMVIYEPIGVSFYDTLHQICYSLRTDTTGLVFFLKTVFIGNTDGSDPECIPNIRPLILIGFDIQSTFDITGSNHTVKFVSIKDGYSHSPQITSIGSDIKLRLTPQNQILNKALTALQDTINERYNKKINKLKEMAQKNGCKFDENLYKKVRYEILVQQEYMDASYMINSDDWKKEPNGDIVLDFGNNLPVEGCIETIMFASKKVLDEKMPNGNKVIFKISNEFASTSEEIIITYKVFKFEVKPHYVGDNQEAIDKLNSEIEEDMRKNSIEFDYIFTGMNTDIEENGLDMKLDLGQAYFQTLLMTPSLPTSLTEAVSPGSSTSYPIMGPAGGQSKMPRAGTKDVKPPLFYGPSTRDELARNSIYRTEVSNYRNFLSNFVACSNVSAAVTIHGNPDLMTGPYPDETYGYNGSNFDRFFNMPHYVKINIKYPDSRYPDGQYEILPFWYQGYYLILSIENIFDGGLFRQTLHLITQPILGTTADKASDAIKQSDSCFNLPEVQEEMKQIDEKANEPATTGTATKEFLSNKALVKSKDGKYYIDVLEKDKVFDLSGTRLPNIKREVDDFTNIDVDAMSKEQLNLFKIKSSDAGVYMRVFDSPAGGESNVLKNNDLRAGKDVDNQYARSIELRVK